MKQVRTLKGCAPVRARCSLLRRSALRQPSPGRRRNSPSDQYAMFIEVASNIPSDRPSPTPFRPSRARRSPWASASWSRSESARLRATIIDIRRSTDRQDTREIIRVLDREPLFHEEDLRFYRWSCQLLLHVPRRGPRRDPARGIDIESLLWAVKCGDAEDLTPLQRSIVDSLGRRSSGMPLRSLEKELGKKTLLGRAPEARETGILSLEERMRKPVREGQDAKDRNPSWRAPAKAVKLTDRQRLALMAIEARGGRARVAELGGGPGPPACPEVPGEKGLVSLGEEGNPEKPRRAPGRSAGAYTPLTLNAEQQAALGTILNGISLGCLLAPACCTGSPEAARRRSTSTPSPKLLAEGGGAIYLVPEIALTTAAHRPASASGFPAGRSPSCTAASRSARAATTSGERLERGDAEDRRRRPVGHLCARPAICGSSSSTRSTTPPTSRTSACPTTPGTWRWCAAKQQGAAVVLGSATPGLQSFYNTRENGQYRLSRPRHAASRTGSSRASRSWT
ncbi:MAG: hypothetical protein MZU91_04590 [Desulfosudis oleivorans]|nr:hypothetical protein [Desulfosudis oleivorans]